MGWNSMNFQRISEAHFFFSGAIFTEIRLIFTEFPTKI